MTNTRIVMPIEDFMSPVPAKTPLPKKLIISLVALVLLFVVIPAVLFATHSMPFTSASDSGVQACQQIAHNAANGGANDDGSAMTDGDRQKARKPFEDSRYTDLKIAGTNMIDTVYAIDNQMKSATDEWEAAGVGLGAMGTLTSQWTALQTACANHGVTIPSLMG